MAEQEAGSLESLTREFFAPAVGSTFEIVFEDGTRHPIDLTAIRDVFVGGGREDKRQAFSLNFLGAATHYVRQGIHAIEHPALGRLSFFIVPLGPAPQNGRMQYEAIFT